MEETSKQRRRKRRSSFSPDVLSRIAHLSAAWPDASPGVIEKELQREAASQEAAFAAGDIPSSRSIYDFLKKLRPQEQSGHWSLADASDDEAALVLPVWQEVVEHSDGRVPFLRLDEAREIARVRRALSGEQPYPMGPSYWDIYMLAREYVRCAEREIKPAAADAFLAFAPWRGANAFRYNQAVTSGQIPRLPYSSSRNVQPNAVTQEEAGGR